MKREVTVSVEYEMSFTMTVDDDSAPEEVGNAADIIAAPIHRAVEKATGTKVWEKFNVQFGWAHTTVFDTNTGEERFDVG